MNPVNVFDTIIFDTNIVPYLLDPEDPLDWATLQRVCKAWNEALRTEGPYFWALEQRLSPTGTWREAFINYPRSTLAGRMGRAYDRAVARTSTLEARGVPVVLNILLASRLPRPIGGTGLAGSVVLSMMPSPLLENAHIIEDPRVTDVLQLLIAVSLIVFMVSLGCFELKRGDNPLLNLLNLLMDALMVHLAVLSHFAFVMPGAGDSQLSKAYRVAKGSLATSVPLAKAAYRRLQNLFR